MLATIAVSLSTATACTDFTLTSPLFSDGNSLPAELGCTRDGGDGLSPPLTWSGVPKGTKSFALVEHHYPRGTEEGVDEPNFYWLLWDIPATTREISRGNLESVGHSGGGSKRSGGKEYVPPCSPPESGVHTYTITIYALNSETIGLPSQDDRDVDWAALMAAIDNKVIDQSSLSFLSGHPRERDAANN